MPQVERKVIAAINPENRRFAIEIFIFSILVSFFFFLAKLTGDDGTASPYIRMGGPKTALCTIIVLLPEASEKQRKGFPAPECSGLFLTDRIKFA